MHVWGNACWFDDLEDLCLERNITRVEDASESLGTLYNEGVYKGNMQAPLENWGAYLLMEIKLLQPVAVA